MDKPFDFKVLEERLKGKGLQAVEGLAEIVADEVISWTKDSLAIHPNALVKGLGLPAVAVIEPMIKGAIDKIDGQPG